jgi:NADPH2:quinone reductase
MVNAGELKPLVSARYPFDKVADALNAVSARKVIGKIVLTPT